MNKKCSWLFGIFFIMLLYPLVGSSLDEYFTLKGVAAKKEKPIISGKALWDGSYQADMSEYLLGDMPGRNLFVKLNSQILYSVFGVSSNSNIVIGDEKQLYEPEYLSYSLNIWAQPSDEEVSQLVHKLVTLEQALQQQGKQLYILITPSKARYYADEAPMSYKLCMNTGGGGLLAYDKFISNLEQTELKVFDSIAFINENCESFEFPLWYASGIHWSRALGSEVAVEFNKYLNETSGYNLGQIEVTHEQIDEPVAPDADLYETLNLFVLPNEQYHTQQFAVHEGTDKPNVFFRGGSFMGQSVSPLIKNDIFENDIYFENNNYFTNNYTTHQVLSDFNAYGEMGTKIYEDLEQSDIVVLEVNENKIFMMSWGFIDYLLDYFEIEKGE